jgi:acyl transferase domain-containing protein
MGENQYRDEPLYRDIIDYCSEYLEPTLGLDLRQFIIDSQSHSKNIDELINETWITQPLLFITEYALAKLWMSWGVQPDAMIGHSLGEYVAACLSGVIELDTALTLVCQRGRLMWSAPQGSMLAISQSASEVNLRSFPDLSIAAVNLENAIVVAGPEDSINELANVLEKNNIAAIKLQTSHAFHSSMMDCILDEFKSYVEKQQFSEPKIPYISNISGSWVTELEVKNSEYWIDHLRSTVQFSKGLDTLLTGENLVFLELGPKAVLSGLVKKKAANKNIKAVIPCLNTDTLSQEKSSYEALVNAWKNSVHIVWKNYYAQDQLSRIPLPTYPFERKRHWIDAPAPGSYAPIKQLQGRRPLDEWFYLPHWRPTISPAQLDLNVFSKERRVWLILANESALCRETIEFLSSLNHSCGNIWVQTH